MPNWKHISGWGHLRRKHHCLPFARFPNTLQKAYAELERRGLCFSVPGSGRFVARNAQTLLMLRSQKRQEELGKLLSELMETGMSRNELHAFVDDIADQRSGKEKI